MNKMSKSQVYSWRVTPALKADLEAAARAEKVPLSALLERIAEDWLSARQTHDDEAEQSRLRAALMACVGSYKGPAGGVAESATNERVRQVMGEALMKKWRASQRRAPKRSR